MPHDQLPPLDPPPQPPGVPEPDECCNSGCVPCVYDLYDEALAQYRLQLATWLARQPLPEHE
ncbi:MAG: oxidoreductase-like domain-containing protein [Dyella sp.]